MKQTTVKRVIEALHWIHNNEHNSVYLEWPRNMAERDKTVQNASHITLANHHERLRIPDSLRADVWRYIAPNKRPFDTRMYAVTRRGLKLVREAFEE